MSGSIGIGVFVAFSLICFPSYAANPYKMGDVAFFERKKSQKLIEEFDFREPNYTPPATVLRLLETPTIENAKAYIDWQKEKIERINKAQQVIEQAMKEEVNI